MVVVVVVVVVLEVVGLLVVGRTLGVVLGRGHQVFSVEGVGMVAGVDGVGGGVAMTPGPPMAKTWLMVLSMGNLRP